MRTVRVQQARHVGLAVHPLQPGLDLRVGGEEEQDLPHSPGHDLGLRVRHNVAQLILTWREILRRDE